jgi:IS6 family transposase
MRNDRPKIFRGRYFADEVILLCVRWYLRYSLSYRDVEELTAERGLGMGDLQALAANVVPFHEV